MKEKEKMPDGPESSAGDDFHLLWAIRKSLELFNFKPDGLKALTIEGGAPEDAKAVDPDGDLLLGVDVGEYFGGEDFGEAQKLIFTQLKYSTRHPTMPWTIARICHGKKSAHAGSIIHRLAGICKAHLDAYGETVVKEKLRLKLISNRPAADEVLDLIKAVKAAIDAAGSLLPFAKLKNAVDAAHHDGLERFKDASGLPAKDIALFISLLDFSSCGAGSRAILKEDTIWAINKVNSVTQVESYNALHVKVWNKMMPESREDNKLTIIDMLKIFNVGTINQLFPVPARFEPRRNLVRRLQLEHIATEIKCAGELPVCLHAGAGMGKSSVIHQLQDELPEGSAVMLFDCYGGGSYLDPDDARHKPEWALKQIANQMALDIGSDFFLLPSGQPSETYYRDFQVRLGTAANILRETHAEALLVVVIDAADNSVTAAGQKGERSFVLDMVKLPLPEGCRLLVTTRSYRLTTLQLPTHVLIELRPFEKEETLARVEPIFTGISEEQALAFHHLTYGIPRVQTYALVNINAGIEAILEPLKPSGKKLDDLMLANIEFVKNKLGEPDQVDRVFLYLITLPRPVSVAALIELAGTSAEVVMDIVTDTGQGIVPNSGTLSLTDEDFEDYLDRTYPATSEIHQAIAEYFLTKASSDAYSSRHLGNALRLAGYYDTLKEIVFSGQYLAVPQDPVVLKQMVIERTMAAMALSIAENNPVDFLKLQVVAAEAAKTNDLLEQTLLANADLTALFGDSQTIEKLLHADRLTWYAPAHYRCAAVYARNKETLAEAKEHFKAARSWMDWRDRQNAHEFQKYHMSTTDFVFAAEATCRLLNQKAALDLLYRYNYDRIGLLSRQFLQQMLIVGPEAEVDKAVKSVKWFIRGKLNITRGYFKSGRKSPIAIGPMVDKLLTKLAGRKLLHARGKETVLEITEYLSWQRHDSTAIRQLLSYVSLKGPGYFPRFYASNFNQNKELVGLDLLFKSKCLAAVWADETVTMADFYSQKIRSADPTRYDPNDSAIEERQRADILFGSVLPLYIARAKYLAGKLDEGGLLKVFQTFPETQHRNYDLYRYHREIPYFQQHFAAIFSDLGLYVADKAVFCKALLDAFTTRENAIVVRLDIATTLSQLAPGHLVALSLLKETAEMIFNAETGAGAKINDYLRCVRIGARLDHTVGRAYFKNMIDTVGEMDLEGFDQVRFIGELARSFEGRYPKTSFDYARFTQFAHSRLHAWDHFPWQESIAGIAALDHFGVWARLAQWDHLNLIKADDYLLTANESSLRKGLLPPAAHAALLVIAGRYPDEFTRQLTTLIGKAAVIGQAALSSIGYTFYRLICFECVRYLRVELLTELSSALTKAGCIDRALLALIARFISEQEKELEEEAPDAPEHCRADAVISVPAIDWSDTSVLKNMVKEWSGVNERSTLDLLVAIRSKCGIGQYLSFLIFLTELDDEVLYYHDREKLLEDTLALWKDHPSLPDWKTEHFLPYLQRAFPAYTEHRELLNTPSLRHIAKLFGANEQQLANGLKVTLAKNIERLDAGVIYQLGAFTKAGLGEVDRLGVIEWALHRWMAKIPDTWQATQWEEKFRVPDDPQQAATGLLRYFLGHPRKELRWRALHGLRLAGRMGDLSLLPLLLAAQDEKRTMPFQQEAYTYYWISAKLWLWILMKKLAEEGIAGIAVFAGVALSTLEDAALPHTLIRYHVQQFCLTMEAALPGTFTKSQLEKISTALRPPAGQKKIGIRQDSLFSLNELKFHFDTTDTVPYWYQPLCRVFDVPYLTIANRADQVITQDWGYNGNVNDDDNVKVDDRSYGSTTNGHGDIPAIEKLQHYYEFHAMFCVASGLLEKASSKGDAAAALKEWLEGWNTTFDGLWLSDLRDVTPPDASFNTPERPSDWQESISDEYVSGYLQVNENRVIISASIKLTYGSEYESVRVSSALVAKDKGRSLLYALQDMPMHRYKLPEEGEDDHEVEKNGFVLKGWCVDIGGRNNVHDLLDPLANELNQRYLRPGDTFMDWGGFTLSPDFREVIHAGAKTVCHFENWDDSSRYPDSHQVETKGQRLSIEQETLLKFLQEHHYSLIVEVQIDRDEQRRSYRDDADRLDIELKNIYLIEADGTVKTIGGDFKIGQDAC